MTAYAVIIPSAGREINAGRLDYVTPCWRWTRDSGVVETFPDYIDLDDAKGYIADWFNVSRDTIILVEL